MSMSGRRFSGSPIGLTFRNTILVTPSVGAPDVDELFPSEPLEDDVPYVADDTFPNDVVM